MIKSILGGKMKMLVFDLDGTLLDNNRNMFSENIDYLNKLKNDGYIVVVATGRTLLSAYNKLNKIDCVNYIISDTGASIYDVNKKEIVFNKTISKNIVSSILDLYDERFKYIEICSNGLYYKYSLSLEEKSDICKTYKDKNLLLADINEISHMAFSLLNNGYVMEMYNYLIKNYTSFDCIVMQDSFSNSKSIEILPKMVSKYNAINKLANYLNIQNDEIMVFGDGLNDIEMIEKCGIGVAMNNALNEVKEKANYITKKTNEELGVIDFLKEYLNNKNK